MGRDLEKHRAYQKAWRERNKEKVAAYSKEYGPKWFQANKERLRSVRKAWRDANIEKARAMQLKCYYKHADEYNKKAKVYRDSHVEERKETRKKYREVESENQRKYYQQNPEKFRARWILNREVRIGRIIKPEICSRCKKKGMIHGHHPDYSKPLEVLWLCVSCHTEIHL